MWLAELIASARWHRTTYIQPHEYILEREHPALFAQLTALLAEQGYSGMFSGCAYHYVNIANYKYWVIDDVLNRALLPSNSDSGALHARHTQSAARVTGFGDGRQSGERCRGPD